MSGLENYTVGRAIGRGHFAVVYKARNNKLKTLVALKKISLFELSEDAKQKTLKEVELLRYLEHPNIIRCYESFLVENDLFIACEYAELGDLTMCIKKLYDSGRCFEEPLIWYQNPSGMSRTDLCNRCCVGACFHRLLRRYSICTANA